MAVEAYEKNRYGLEGAYIRPTFDGKGMGVAVAVRTHKSWVEGDWEPEVLHLGHIAPYDEAIANESQRERDETEAAARRHAARTQYLADIREEERRNSDRRETADQWCLETLPRLNRALQRRTTLTSCEASPDLVNLRCEDLEDLIAWAIRGREFIL